MVFTDVTIEGQTHEMWLCVMDGANKAMKAQPYTYKVRNGEKTVDAATMFDINKTIMRCLVKNLAMFGLGLYIYAGEDLPEEVKPEPIVCEECGSVINNTKTKDGVLTPLEIKQRSEEKFGKCICFACAKNQSKVTDEEQSQIQTE